MIKKKIDRQKTGQSSATPFMQVNDCTQSNDRSGKRGVTFDMMETLERHSDSIDKLTSLVSKMNVKMDKMETPYELRVYQGRPRGQIRGRHQNFQPSNRSFSRDRNRNRGNYNSRNNNRPNCRDRSRDNYRQIGETTTGLMKDKLTIDKTVGEETATDKTIEIGKIIEEMTPDKDSEIGVKVGTDQGHIVATEVETEIEGRCNKDPELCQMTEKDLGLGPIQE